MPQTLWNIKQIETYYFRQTAFLSPLRGFCALKSLQLETDERSHEREKDRLLALENIGQILNLRYLLLPCPVQVPSVYCATFFLQIMKLPFDEGNKTYLRNSFCLFRSILPFFNCNMNLCFT